mgnify:CR=1 FL=1
MNSYTNIYQIPSLVNGSQVRINPFESTVTCILNLRKSSIISGNLAYKEYTVGYLPYVENVS